MAKKTDPEDELAEDFDEEEVAEDDIDLDDDELVDIEEDIEDIEDDFEVEDFDDDGDDDDEVAVDDGDDDGDDDDEALDELEAEELEMLTDDEASEVISIDEDAEMRALRREELALDVDPEQAGRDEFVCRSCFLVKRISQLADRRKMICRDCAS